MVIFGLVGLMKFLKHEDLKKTWLEKNVCDLEGSPSGIFGTMKLFHKNISKIGGLVFRGGLLCRF